ncbi:helix-turn-helix domain-containing protein [Geminicoccus harenae]|uniref:helix-turn-helix domain-containing protein n=1 Tax=Geminicoccus harenae TaxID=2498453 RepID=UPI001C975A6C|nr:helix-turn-helix domain-containing protein [Geminicoccus harenae]
MRRTRHDYRPVQVMARHQNDSGHPLQPEKNIARPPDREAEQATRRRWAGHSDLDEPLLTPEDVVKLTRSSMRSFRRWTASGQLEVVRLGRLVRVRRSALNAFLHKQ